MDDGTIEFACHELHYNKKGLRMAIPPQPNSPIPKQAKIMAIQIIEQDGLVWIWTGDAAKAKSSKPPRIPEILDDEWETIDSGPMDVPANYLLLIENLLDITHFYPLHAGNIGDILICPATSVPPFPVEEPFCSHINGQQLERNVSWLAITYGITHTAHPAIAIPCGKDHTGMPFGIQIVGRRRVDAFVLGVANELERLFATKSELARPGPRLSN